MMYDTPLGCKRRGTEVGADLDNGQRRRYDHKADVTASTSLGKPKKTETWDISAAGDSR
jgi:hypothetical protein